MVFWLQCPDQYESVQLIYVGGSLYALELCMIFSLILTQINHIIERAVLAQYVIFLSPEELDTRAETVASQNPF